MNFMPYFTKKELLMSLCCPAITFMWGLFHVFLDFPWGGDFSEKGFLLLLNPDNGALIGLAAVLVGGVLPAYLTLSHKIHTEKRLIIRLIVIVAIYAVNDFIRDLIIDGGTAVTTFELHMIVNVSTILIQILTFKKQNTPPGEMAVLILSDPILYWAIYYLAYYLVVFIK
ncbi:MAG: hypothetical protein K2J80_11090 [Oscillospiraceae bacterium]|nr:hypothetical protein [Oscillospiraceae bacterium]